MSKVAAKEMNKNGMVNGHANGCVNGYANGLIKRKKSESEEESKDISGICKQIWMFPYGAIFSSGNLLMLV